MLNKLKTAVFITLIFTSSSLFAMAQRPVDPNAPAPPAWVTWFPIIMMVFVFYFFLIRPQSKQKKERENMLTNLKKGDKIITQGGIFATIVNATPTHFEIKINDETKVRIQRTAVADVVVDAAPKEKESVKS